MTRRLSPSELRREIGRLLKGAQHSQTMPPSNEVYDHWTSGYTNRAPTREQVVFGPTQAANGGSGLSRMVGDYSDPAPQHGATRTAGELARDLAVTRAEAKGIELAVENLKAATAKLAAHVAANQDRWAEGDADDDDASEATKAARDRRRLRALRKRVREADEEVEDAETASERKRAARKATQARQDAVKALTGQVNDALHGLGLLTSDIKGVNQILLGRGRAGGIPPMQKASDLPTTPFMKASVAKRTEILKATAAGIAAQVQVGAIPPKIEAEIGTFLRILGAPTQPDPTFLKKYLQRMSSDAQLAVSHLVS